MKRSYSLVTAIIFFALVFSGVGTSQTLQETLTKLTGTAGEAYVAPIISAFGSNLNSGWVHRSPSSKVFGVDIEVGVVAMATMFAAGALKTKYTKRSWIKSGIEMMVVGLAAAVVGYALGTILNVAVVA